MKEYLRSPPLVLINPCQKDLLRRAGKMEPEKSKLFHSPNLCAGFARAHFPLAGVKQNLFRSSLYLRLEKERFWQLFHVGYLQRLIKLTQE